MLRQSQQQKLLQRLSPQQIQLMKLLQVPTAQLEERIKEELEENPALEYGSEHSEEESFDKEDDTYDEEPIDLTDDYSDKVDLEEYIKNESSDGSSDYDYSNDDYRDSESSRPGVSVESSFQDHLTQQLAMYSLSERSEIIARQIIGSIDEDGYLRRAVPAIADDLAFSQNIIVDEQEVDSILKLIQHFDPPGVGASTLQECLLLQLQLMTPSTDTINLAIRVIRDYFDEFSKKHFEKIQKSLDINEQIMRSIVQLILKLNPKPGAAFSGGRINQVYIIPDFFIYNNNGILEVSLNSKNAPELRVSEGYKEMMISYDKGKQTDKHQKEAVMFIKQKLDAAKWFINAIKQRQNTLLITMQAIATYQKAFFLSGDDTVLKPMILKDIAEMTQLDVSTVSRVANSKFVQTEFGTYILKYFFSEALNTDSGEEVSSREVKRILSDLIADENKKKPLSDEVLTSLLVEKGYQIARRTIAKYREQLNIPVARLRREV